MANELLKIFKALADETRIEIIQFLSSEKELSCQDLSKNFSLSQPTFSHHINKLLDAGIIKIRKEGTNHFYSINKDYLQYVGIDISKLQEKRGGEINND